MGILVKNQNLVHPELSYKVIGAAFKLYNVLGWGHKELIYQRALGEEFSRLGIPFVREKIIQLNYENKEIGRYICDFVLDNKIIIELKVVNKLGYTHIKQVLSYLKAAKLPLAILVYFTKEGVKYRRVVNVI